MQRRSLNCWKEIASYLGCGVRTAQRWERNLGLPVRRPNVSEYRIVVAFEDELDNWRQMWRKAQVAEAEALCVSLDRLDDDLKMLQSMIRERAQNRSLRSIVITFCEASASPVPEERLPIPADTDTTAPNKHVAVAQFYDELSSKKGNRRAADRKLLSSARSQFGESERINLANNKKAS